MSLDYDLSDIKDFKTVCWEGNDMHHATNALIWATMVIGIPEITEKNYLNFFQRVYAWEKHVDAWRSNLEGKVCFTLDEVKSHIGLCTNSNQLTEKQFVAKLGQEIYERAGLSVKRIQREASEKVAA